MTNTLCNIIIKYHPPIPNLMTVTNNNWTKSKYRITLEIDAFDDFNPRQIAWDKMLQMGDNESVVSYIEDLSNPVRW